MTDGEGERLFVLSVSGDSAIAVTGPDGAQVSGNPVDGQTVADIPQASYSQDRRNGTQYILIWDAVPGDYAVEISGEEGTPVRALAQIVDPTGAAVVVNENVDIGETGVLTSTAVVPELLSDQPLPPEVSVSTNVLAVEVGQPFDLSVEIHDFNIEDAHSVGWDFGDGSEPESGLSISHTYLATGHYSIAVTVSDPAGLNVTKAIDVTVTNPVGPALTRVRVYAGTDPASGGKPGYVVRVFAPDGRPIRAGTTNSQGVVDLPLVDGTYPYSVEKAGARSTLMPLTVSGGVAEAHYRLATVVVHVADSAGTGRSGYIVRIYNGVDGSGSEWGNATTNASGDATFYLVDGAYGYRVDKASATGTKVGFTVAPANPTPNNQTLTYTLATVMVHVADSSGVGRGGYVVRVINGVEGTGSEWGNATTNAGGDATFYLISGTYQYQIQKSGYDSGRLPVGGFFVVPGQSMIEHFSLP